jgi:hypothetical protein
MVAHESPRTTKLYDRTGDEITLDEVGGSRFDAIAFIKAHADTWSEIEGRRICHRKAWVPEGAPMFLPFSDAEVRAFALLNGYDRVAATDGIIALRIESQATARIATNSKFGETIERELFYFVNC